MAVFDNLNKSYSPGVAPSVVEYYERSLLENMKPEMVHNRDAQKRTLPEHNGKTVKFRRFTPFAAITEPLAEGVTPAGQTLTETAFTAMVKPYGGHVELTDEINFYLLDNMHQETAKLLGDQAALSLDTISRNALNAGMNVQYANSKTSRGALAATDKLTFAEIKTAVRNLKRKNVKPFADGFYHAIVHPDVVHDLTADSMWVDVAKYQDKVKTERYELGTIYKVKFFESTNAMVFKAQTYIYGTKASLTATAFDAATKCMTVSDSISEDDARAMTGLLVNVQITKSSVDSVTPMCIERVDATNKKVYFRWVPASTTDWTTTNSLKIVPYGGGASGAEVYSTLIYGENAFGTIELGGTGRNVQIIINAPGSSGALDPLAQRGTIAWKVKGFCTVILQDDFIVRLESGATA
nr:MAG TPA: major capsid protein [Caudoviricetes sp.]